MRPLALVLASVLALAGANAAAHEGHVHPPATAMSEALSREHLLLPDIPVTDATGATEGFRTRYGQAGPVLISILYTGCDDTCGMIRGVMQLVDQDLQRPDAPRLTLIAVSVDPARDTPEALARQAAQMQASARWDWVVASPRDTPALLSAFGLPAGPVEAHEAVYLLGDLATGRFLRIPGVPDPDMLIRHARDIAPGS
ncbi:SCO family protein [Paracoccus liaowanqingii]|uniref:SCO family protein n=1 Tax=Paracoccus liaowanqingii TaxID=2560053 RepID=A0A4Z1BL95_9RHOB|nr:SCO family protein [Paracoccus liaowanqingii]TGN36888.1 SCO family protein [Paracoccus liaowanqingii]